MPNAAELADRIAVLLARTHQHPYEADVVAGAAEVLAGWGEGWVAIVASPSSLTDLPLAVAGCLGAYAAALREDGRPDLTADRLACEAAAKDASADWHERHAAEFARKAQTWDEALRPHFQGSAAAHAECARRDRAAAAAKRAICAALVMAPKAA